jgi:hypothetical protein
MSWAVQRDGSESALNTVREGNSMRRGSPTRQALALVVVLGLYAILLAGCNQGLGAFESGVGNTPNVPPGASFRFLGEPGLQFSGVVSDANFSWPIQGSVPMNVIIVNNTTPVRVNATKLSSGNGILSLQLTLGFTVEDVSSTNDPYGTVSIQNNPEHPGFAPPPRFAAPDDVRLYVKGPITERFSGLFEDQNTAFLISDRAPAIFLFDSPVGAVDATVTQTQNFGPLNVDILLNGGVVASARGGPTVLLRQP